jgi:predicted RNase H-like nuclease (RuvC/YqgF family)
MKMPFQGGAAVNDYGDIRYLRQRVQELEEKVEQLRLSRRVLMNLIEKMEKEKSSFYARLEKENRKLHLDNYRYAKWLLRKNQRIVELESRLEAGESN